MSPGAVSVLAWVTPSAHARAMSDPVFKRVLSLFDVPHMQNSLRGLWVEAMIAELLAAEWRFSGSDYAAWDFERLRDGLRLEVKQSARHQSWGTETKAPRFSIAVGKGHWPTPTTYERNESGVHLADAYVFAWHEGNDQRVVSQWIFYPVRSVDLPHGQKSIGLSAIRKLAKAVPASELKDSLDKL